MNLSEQEEKIKFINEKCSFFKDAQLWPVNSRMNHLRWIENFELDEQDTGYTLLDNFIFINDEMATSLLEASILSVSTRLFDFNSCTDVNIITQGWNSFMRRAVFCPVRGEEPSITDSGYAYIRKAKKNLGIDEKQMINPDEALLQVYSDWINGGDGVDVIFIDDFIGSGNQFVETWETRIDAFNVEIIDFEDMASRAGCKSRFFYCSLLSTEKGRDYIMSQASKITLCPAYIIGEEYSIESAQSIIWNDEEQTKGLGVLSAIARRYGMPADNNTEDWLGFGKQGLCIGIRDMIPDASIGVYRWKENDWIPLLK